MVRDDSTARRYAAALFAQAERNDTLDATAADLAQVAQDMATVPGLRVLSQALVTEDRKKSLLASVFGTQIQLSTQHFIELLIDKRRMDHLEQISHAFTELVREHRNIAEAHAISAVPLTDAQAQSLLQSLEARTGKKIELKRDVDPTLIGGVLVRIGDTVYDGSVRGNLERLREQMLTRR